MMIEETITILKVSYCKADKERCSTILPERAEKEINDYILALELAINVLKKQIPKKVETYKDQFFLQGYLINEKYYNCPCCKKTYCSLNYMKEHPEIKTDCCKYCGQRLDWSEEK